MNLRKLLKMTQTNDRTIKISTGNEVLTDNSTNVELANNLADALIYLLKEADHDGICYEQIFKRLDDYLFESYLHRNKLKVETRS